MNDPTAAPATTTTSPESKQFRTGATAAAFALVLLAVTLVGLFLPWYRFLVSFSFRESISVSSLSITQEMNGFGLVHRDDVAEHLETADTGFGVPFLVLAIIAVGTVVAAIALILLSRHRFLAGVLLMVGGLAQVLSAALDFLLNGKDAIVADLEAELPTLIARNLRDVGEHSFGGGVYAVLAAGVGLIVLGAVYVRVVRLLDTRSSALARS
ncbi:MAG: hypothetical protein QM809_17720 [Gordonia sp. (in: high G+C Gram-positive bacteria)]|uniref:hypothetical protein n=1 Tax=Gordonia sp. (in: high G+C Gram-positive bacteria) TaxID=84139 RepID=UPI0039E6B19A